MDPALLFSRHKYLSELVGHLASGKNVWNVNPNHDERLKQKMMIEYFVDSKEILVFGSSRCKGIRKGLFPGKSFYNAGVGAGTLEDFIGIYQIFYEKKLLPKTLIIELSAWVLNPKNNLIHGDVRTLESEYQRGLDRLGLSLNHQLSQVPIIRPEVQARQPHWRHLLELMSPSYFQQSLRLMIKDFDIKNILKKTNRYHFRFTDGNIDNEFVLMSDGSWLSSEENRIVSKIEAVAFVPKGLNDFMNLSKERIDEFESFINIVIEDGVEVIFYLPPWPPEAYNRFIKSENTRIVTVIEDYLRKFAKINNIKVVGSYNPEYYGFSLDDFSDSAHLRRSVMSKLF
jgi:hypothetical protein